MKNRNTKRRNHAVTERATGQIGPFPFHRAGSAMQDVVKVKADLQERLVKSKLKRAK